MLYSSYSWASRWLLFPLLLAPVLAQEQPEGANNPDDPGLSRYVSRPDLAAPIWDVKVYHEDLIAPGYWFVAPYKALNQLDADRSWVGPHIYHGKTGELVWSGSLSYFFSKGNVEDFRMSNVRGKNMMTLMSQGKGQGVILNNNYKIAETLQVDNPGSVNTHEFHFVENGTRALVIKSHRQKATKEMSKAVGYDGECDCQFDGFEEYDTTTWKSTFDWRSFGKVGLDESSLTGPPVAQRCRNGWDFIHANSADKTPEGDYLWSSRHCDTIYKISKKDGSIIWRLGGKKSDFELVGEDMVFSRQHDIRHRSQNETHVIITILDNARGIDKQAPTWDKSRGLRIALDEKNMKASVERTYDHPEGEGGFAPRRGNHQILNNGNIFMGWSERAEQSEHSPDGTLLMEAEFKTDWLGSYRNYKFEFVGEPIEPPVAHAQAYGTPNNSTTTTVHVSWNGATEVASWNLYRTVANGQVLVLVASAEKLGFETVLAYGGYASYVIVEAVNRNGTVLGRTEVSRTFAHANVTAEAVAGEDVWLKDVDDAEVNLLRQARGVLTSPITAFIIGCICSAIVLIVGYKVRSRDVVTRYMRYFKGSRYDKLSQMNLDQELPLRAADKEAPDDI
ncbi:hypothetical protein LTR37_007536 [Vermiconidia calcicola]|uniref:Uncharacterized protein n=1 Tax=Vermiconidia calcicola TaxID=1690605 RepID=A0ACC3NDC8_9PEZI|nr:hypothetical protein LTR37_007536 [Vermiconidia calcicola]